MKMSFGNSVGFTGEDTDCGYGDIIAELTEDCDFGQKIGVTTAEPQITLDDETVSIRELYELNTATLEKVYPTKTLETEKEVPTFGYKATSYPAPAVMAAWPKVLSPVFPGTNCEYDSARAVLAAGAEADIVTVMYFLLPISTVWTSIFVSEFFFSDRTRDVLFFYSRKKRFAVSQLFFLLPLVILAAVMLVHFL